MSIPTREQLDAQAWLIIARAVTETDHASLAVDDLVFWNYSTVCWKILAIDGEWATISDKKTEMRVPLTDLASDENVRVCTYKEIYGDRCVLVTVPDRM